MSPNAPPNAPRMPLPNAPYILHRLLPDPLTHPGLELADRRQTQHVLVLASALFILAVYGQAGPAKWSCRPLKNPLHFAGIRAIVSMRRFLR